MFWVQSYKKARYHQLFFENNIRNNTNSYMSSTQDDCKSQSCLSDERGEGCEGCERTNSNFLYRKLFTPDLNVFSFIQKLLFYPSHPSPVAKTTFVNMSFAPRKRYTYATQTIHLNFKNNMFMNYYKKHKTLVCLAYNHIFILFPITFLHSFPDILLPTNH